MPNIYSFIFDSLTHISQTINSVQNIRFMVERSIAIVPIKFKLLLITAHYHDPSFPIFRLLSHSLGPCIIFSRCVSSVCVSITAPRSGLLSDRSLTPAV